MARRRHCGVAAGCCWNTAMIKARRCTACSRRWIIARWQPTAITPIMTASPWDDETDTMTALLPRPLVNQLLHHAQQQPEQEVCGLIGSRAGVPVQFYPVANVATAAQRRMRERGEGLYAIFHSHPHSPPSPSAIDLVQAAYPEAIYIIASLETK